MEGKTGYDAPNENRQRSDGAPDLDDNDQIFANNKTVILEGIFGCSTPVQLESTIAFARYVSRVGINLSNYPLFLRLVETNNKWVVDALIGKREPHLLFSSIRPNNFLVRKAFLLLSFWHPGQIYPKVLQAVLGIVECACFDPDDGYRIYRIKVADLNNVGKFLDETKDQFDEVNTLVLDVLDRITKMGNYEDNERKRMLAKHAFDIRLAYFDNRKKCADIIPQILLTRLDRETSEVQPTKPFVSFLKAAD